MSIAHLGLAGDQRQSGDIGSGQNRGDSRNDRVPPHDLLAEQSAIGGMLLSKDAVADVIETVRGVDFYIPSTRQSSTRSCRSTPMASRPTSSRLPTS